MESDWLNEYWVHRCVFSYIEFQASLESTESPKVCLKVSHARAVLAIILIGVINLTSNLFKSNRSSS